MCRRLPRPLSLGVRRAGGGRLLEVQGVFTDIELEFFAEFVATDPLVLDKKMMRLQRLPDGLVCVKTGELVAPLDGRGDLILLRLESKQWVVVQRARWGS
jgi:hypothetical protein